MVGVATKRSNRADGGELLVGTATAGEGSGVVVGRGAVHPSGDEGEGEGRAMDGHGGEASSWVFRVCGLPAVTPVMHDECKEEGKEEEEEEEGNAGVVGSACPATDGAREGDEPETVEEDANAGTGEEGESGAKNAFTSVTGWCR